MSHRNPSPLSDEELDHTPLKFGQYKGQTPSQIAEHDPSYLIWVAENHAHHVVSDALVRSCQEDGE